MNLKPTPSGPIYQLGVIGSGDKDIMGGEIIYLKKQSANDPFYFPSIVRISSLFTYRVKFVKKNNTRSSFKKIKGSLEP